MGHEKITEVQMAGKDHSYYMKVDGCPLWVTDKDGDGTIDKVVPLVPPNSPEGPANTAAKFAKYAPIAQNMVTQFRKDLPGEILKLKARMKNIQPQLVSNPLCPALSLERMISRAVIFSGRWGKVYDLNGDQRVDVIGFITSDGVGVDIMAAWNTASSTERCKSIDTLRQGVDEFLKLLDDLPLTVPPPEPEELSPPKPQPKPDEVERAFPGSC